MCPPQPFHSLHPRPLQEYAADNGAFQRDFAVAYQKLAATGVTWRAV